MKHVLLSSIKRGARLDRSSVGTTGSKPPVVPIGWDPDDIAKYQAAVIAWRRR